MKRPDHLFVSSVDGALYDTRVVGWHTLPPLRPDYERWFGQLAAGIKGVRQLKAILRLGRRASNYGETYFITLDGEALSFDAVRENYRQVVDAILHKSNNGWCVAFAAYQVEQDEEDPLICAHTGEVIE